MIRLLGAMDPVSTCAPRVSGDDPGDLKDIANNRPCSPRERG